MFDLYIYYQVSDALAPMLAPRVRAMQAALLAAHGVAGQLKRRPEAREGLQTWMEIYTATPPGFEAELDAAVSSARLAAHITGARHTEQFTDLSPCA